MGGVGGGSYCPRRNASLCRQDGKLQRAEAVMRFIFEE